MFQEKMKKTAIQLKITDTRRIENYYHKNAEDKISE
jgi:hypothetical protein